MRTKICNLNNIASVLVASLLLCGCNPNAPKYESILDEVLSCMVPDSDSDGVHLMDEDVAKLRQTFLYHCGFLPMWSQVL